MPIRVELQDERGGTIGLYLGPHLDLGFVESASQETSCFRFIDPWGDTTFNQEQIPVLIAEFKAEALKTSDLASRIRLDALIDFVEGARDSMHTYVKFIGD